MTLGCRTLTIKANDDIKCSRGPSIRIRLESPCGRRHQGENLPDHDTGRAYRTQRERGTVTVPGEEAQCIRQAAINKRIVGASLVRRVLSMTGVAGNEIREVVTDMGREDSGRDGQGSESTQVQGEVVGGF